MAGYNNAVLTNLQYRLLMKMSIKKFERLIEASPFEFASLELLPIRKL